MFKSPIRINEFTGGIKHDQVKISPFAKVGGYKVSIQKQERALCSVTS